MISDGYNTNIQYVTKKVTFYDIFMNILVF